MEISPSPFSGTATATRPDNATAFGADTPELSWRVLALLNIYRALASLFVLGLFFLISSPRVVGGHAPTLLIFTALLYLLLAFGFVYTIHRRWPVFPLQLYAQIILDIVAIVAMMHASGGIDSGLGNLLVVTVGAASLTVRHRSAGLFAALATIALLVEQSVSQLEGITGPADYTATGVLGAIIFVIALAAQPLARRIRETEALARQRGVDLENLGELNNYIIQHLRESIVVIDADDRVRLMNESAAKILAAGRDPRGRHIRQIAPRLHAMIASWRREADGPTGVQASFPGADGTTVITPHFARLGKTSPPAVLIFLEDASLMAERVQQTKLAALGRLSASIAHEIRNPVGAMSHAGQLLAESPVIGDQERRLTDIIHKNSDRISTIIENVLQLSRRDTVEPESLLLAEWLKGFVGEFAGTHELNEGELLLHAEEPGLEVRMDTSHLQQVLWNLCDNGIKYATESAGGLQVELRSGRMPNSGRPFLEVADRGPGIDEKLAEHIFEPFFTDKSGGTGLGLFIARQLCECNGAALWYEARSGGGSLFRIIFADPQRWAL